MAGEVQSREASYATEAIAEGAKRHGGFRAITSHYIARPRCLKQVRSVANAKGDISPGQPLPNLEANS